MKNQDLLKAIQNADRSFFEKAEQRMHHREEHTMKHIMMRKIMTGAAAVAVLAVTVTGGVYLAKRNSDNLTEPSKSISTTAPIEEQMSQAVTEPGTPTETTVSIATAEKPAETAAVAVSHERNFLDGHGLFRYSPHSSIMCDDDYWYFNDMVFCTKKTDEKRLRQENNLVRCEVLTMEGSYYNDTLNGGIYHIVRYRNKHYIYSVKEDGTETALPFENVFECFSKPDEPDNLCNKQAVICSIMHLKDGKYYLTGYFYDAEKPKSEEYVYFWTIYDTETQTGSGQLQHDTDRVFYDGNTGVYSWLRTDTEDPYGKDRKIVHCLADGSSEIVLERKILSNGWFVYNDCVYYCDLDNGDYCKYDINSQQTTVLIKGAKWCDIFFDGSKIYAVKDQKLYSGTPDTTEPAVWDIPIMEQTKYIEDTLYVEAVCDGTIIFRNVSCWDYSANSSDVFHNPEYWILYQPESGKVQYLCNEESNDSSGEDNKETMMPDFVGKSWDEASQLAGERNLILTKEKVENAAPEGTVIAQDIPAKSLISSGQTIKLIVSGGAAKSVETRVESVEMLMNFAIPTNAAGVFEITLYENGTPKSNTDSFDAAGASGKTAVMVKGSGVKELTAKLKNKSNGKESQIGIYRVDFDQKKYTAIEENVEGAFREVNGLAEKTTDGTNNKRMISPAEARIPNLQNLAGNWFENDHMDLSPRFLWQTPHILCVKTDGSFELTDGITYTSDANEKGTVTVEDGKYTFRFADGRVKKAVPQKDDPLNVLQFEGEENVFCRYDDNKLYYDRQFTPVKEADFNGVSVKELKGDWHFSNTKYLLTLVDGEKTNGSFAFRSEGYAGETVNDSPVTVKGTIKVEQGMDNTGAKQYYYNLYDENSELFMTFQTSDAADDEVSELVCSYFSLSPEVDIWQRV